jgi:2-polyprenyl-3-methyl-5-hydroxy-6-metoxy-1,4-benzoquinol methylase
MIPHSGQKILEVGCGNGYLSLELARDGHEVIGLDQSKEILDMAERTRAAHPDTPGFGKLTYECANISTWQAPEGSFDIIIVNRMLHHLHHLQPALAQVKRLLSNEGLFICQDYAYDRLDDQTASWMYSMQRLLFLSSLSSEDPATTANDVQSIEALRATWFQKSDHRLNQYKDMLQVLHATFHEQFRSWVPYLFVSIANGIRHTTTEQEHALIAFLRNMEQHLIEKEQIQAVGFRYVGSV